MTRETGKGISNGHFRKNIQFIPPRSAQFSELNLVEEENRIACCSRCRLNNSPPPVQCDVRMAAKGGGGGGGAGQGGLEGIRHIGDGLLEVSGDLLKQFLAPGDINDLYDVEQTPFAR